MDLWKLSKYTRKVILTLFRLVGGMLTRAASSAAPSAPASQWGWGRHGNHLAAEFCDQLLGDGLRRRLGVRAASQRQFIHALSRNLNTESHPRFLSKTQNNDNLRH